MKRSVKAWPHHPFEDYLSGTNQGPNGYIDRALSDATCRLYAAAAHRIEASNQTPVDWYAQLSSDRTLSRNTVGVMRTAVAHYMIWQGQVQDRFEADRLLPKPSSRNRDRLDKEAMSEEETEDFLKLVEALPHPLPSYLLLLLYTGLRSQEACDLDVEDIILTGRRPRLEVRAGKGNQPRTVELGRDAQTVLKRYLAHGPKQGPLFLWDYQFKDGPKTRRLQTYVVRRELQAARERIDPNWEVSPHILRHTMATEMHEVGISLENIRKHLGHKSLNVLSRYLTARPGQMTKELDKLPQRETPKLGG